MQVIIAEKPSLAKNIANSIRSDSFTYHKEGYYEGNDYIVVPAFGHLFGLKDMDGYFPPLPDGKKRPWTMDSLPFYPEEFQFELKKSPKTKKVDPGVRDRFALIRELVNRPDVDAVVSAGDSDREGEVIVRLILNSMHNTKPVLRLWLPEQTEEVINEAIQNLEDDAKYDALYNEGLSRTYIDWLYGINFTRYATIKSGRLLRSGRVICAVVKAIYDRDMEIRNFVPEPYFIAVSKEKTAGEEIVLKSKKKFAGTDRVGVEAHCSKYNAAGATVTKVTTKKAVIGAGKLFSQSELQAAMAKSAKMTPAETLAVSQKLYEAGLITYPRTNSQYLGPTESGRIDSILNRLRQEGYDVKQKIGEKSIYDASKIESHSALTPTYKAPGQLSGNELLVYNTIRDRFVAVFCAKDCVVNRTNIVIQVADEEFTIKGDVYVQKGWKEYEKVKTNDTILPNLQQGDAVNINFQPADMKTTPPKHYDVKTLGSYMKNPFKEEKKNTVEETEDAQDTEAEDDADDYKAIFDGLEIGTEATRASIIDNARANEYIQLKNNEYTILPNGEYLMEVLHNLQIDLSKNATARMGKTLRAVYRGDISVEESVEIAKEEIDKAFQNRDVSIVQHKEASGMGGKSVGAVCPYCHGEVIETKKAYGCTTKGCKFVLWKENKLFAAIGQNMTKSIVKQFAKNKYAELKGCTSKSGKKYDCYAVLDDSGERLNMHLTFNDPSPKTGAPVGKCPICGKDVYETKNAFVCEDDACGASIKKNANYYKQPIKVSRTQAEKLLKGEHETFTLTSREGKKYSGYLKLEVNGRYINFKADGFPPKKGK